MKKAPQLLAMLLGIFAVVSIPALSQDVGDQLSKVAGQNAISYLTPLLSGFGADLNSGFYHSADLHGVLGFDIGVKVGATWMKDQDKVFDFVLPDEIVYSGVTLRAGIDYDKVLTGSPTVVGEETGKEVRVKSTSPLIPLRGQTIFVTPQGFNLKAVPLVMPQASIGLPLGFEVIGRFIPTITLSGDAGTVNYFGFGIRHDIDQYIPLCPVDIAIHFVTQKLTLSDKNDTKVLSGSGTAYGAEVSKKLIFVTLYGGFQLESSSWDIEPYEFSDPSTGSVVRIEGFSIDGKNKSRFHAGLRFLLLFLNVHADYSFAKQPVLAAGVGITLR